MNKSHYISNVQSEARPHYFALSMLISSAK